MNFVAKIEDVSHFYKKTKALDSVTLDIPSGSMVGFIGPDGVGKSTLLSIIAGVRKVQRGSVEVLGGDIKSASFRKKVSPRIAYMPQGLGKNLYMLLSVYENMEFFARVFGLDKNERKRRIDGLLKSIGLYEFRDRAVGKLSGGMKQKLGLCCALIHAPDLLILDEPTTGVDPLSRREFWKLIAHIRESQKGVSVLIATAYMQEAEFFDYIVAINDGKILSQGTPKELLNATNTDNIDSAFIELLPKEEKREYKNLNLSKKKELKSSALAIEATELTKKFGDFTAVENVSFQIAQGEIFGFLGSNGCGKTTTMKMLTGLLRPTHGTIKLFGESIKEHSLEMRNDVGYMTQSFSLYNELSVKQNLILHAHLYRIKKSAIDERVEEILERFYIKQYEDSLALDLPLGIKQ
ncbi:MAG: ribosome-dependent ATPase, partial [Campylobacterota bacterium]|nr:ribosome-dependent ATPase [Campylobacterota bacterium]